KKYTEAIPDYTKVISLDPSHAGAYYERGICYLNLGNQAEGCNDLRQAMQLGYQRAQNALRQYCGQ
ncbi:MAG: tetratricopeptide repeat protein, partial [Cyclobacteriaceae bacterium]|nr:tetratricopeptide repeat protein [Cyclobacteriaceae bacterium]